MNANSAGFPLEFTHRRPQRSLRRPATVRGVGFFTNADVALTLLPADENHGLVFQRTDCIDQPRIPADIDCSIDLPRRTALAAAGATVELTEHILAALYGLQVDNCLIQIDGPEPPGCDGSSQHFVDVIMKAGIVDQSALRATLAVDAEFTVEQQHGTITVGPAVQSSLTIGYQLDYPRASPIPQQRFVADVTPDTFANEIAFARTFVLESEVENLRNAGFGQRVTENELLVFREDGTVLGNTLRAPDECARHKLLDCLGDFALIGCDLSGKFDACRSGHRLNREVVKRLRQRQRPAAGEGLRRAV